jgi:large subunit ribosomal protein L20
MPRVKRGTTHVKRRRTLLNKVKGYKWGRKKLIRLAKTAVNKAGQHAYADRKKKKGDFRGLWNIKINAGVRKEGLIYSVFIKKLKDNKVELDRKILADLAENNPETFKEVVNKVK